MKQKTTAMGHATEEDAYPASAGDEAKTQPIEAMLLAHFATFAEP